MALRLADTRSGRGPLLVCHPGGPGMHPRYLEPLTALASHHTVALVHPRGTGNSPRPVDRGAYSLDEYAEDLVAWIKSEAGGEPVDLLGHSHGGVVASLVAAHYPHLVRRLVLLGTPAYGGDEAEVMAEAFQRARLSEPEVARALAILEAQGDAYPSDDAGLGRLIAAVIPLWVGPMSEPTRAWQSQLARWPANVDALRYFNESVFPSLDDAMGHVGEVACPTLAIGGEWDGWAGPDHLTRLSRSLRDCITEVIPRSGHMCHADATQAVVQPIRKFLQKGTRIQAIA